MKNKPLSYALLLTLSFGCNQNNNDGGDETNSDSSNIEKNSVSRVKEQTDSSESDFRIEKGYAFAQPRNTYPKIITLEGTLVKRSHLAKQHDFYVVTQDGAIYALHSPTVPDEGLDKIYRVVGVRMIGTPEYAKFLEAKVKESLLPGQTRPKSPIEAVLYDSRFTYVGESSNDPNEKEDGERTSLTE